MVHMKKKKKTNQWNKNYDAFKHVKQFRIIYEPQIVLPQQFIFA